MRASPSVSYGSTLPPPLKPRSKSLHATINIWNIKTLIDERPKYWRYMTLTSLTKIVVMFGNKIVLQVIIGF